MNFSQINQTCTNSSSSDKHHSIQLHQWGYLTLVVLLTLSGITANIYDLVHLYKRRARWSSLNTFITALTITDLLTAICAPGLGVLTIASHQWMFSPYVCLLLLYLDLATIPLAIIFPLLILDYHIGSKWRISSAASVAVCLVIVLINHLLFLPVYINDMTLELLHCALSVPLRYEWWASYFFIECVLPLLGITFLLTRFSYGALRGSVSKPTNDIELDDVSLKRISSSSVLVEKEKEICSRSGAVRLGIAGVVMWAPLAIYFVLNLFNATDDHVFFIAAYWNSYLSPIVNPIIMKPISCKRFNKGPLH